MEVNRNELFLKIRASGIRKTPKKSNQQGNSIFDFINYLEKQSTGKHRSMQFFIMYDISDNKIRGYIAKYLEREGCTRIQKSVFFGDLPRKRYVEIKSTLAEVNEYYENSDSIIITPLSSEEVDKMELIGQNCNFKFVLENQNTLFI